MKDLGNGVVTLSALGGETGKALSHAYNKLWL